VHRDDDAHALSRGAALRLERLDDTRPSEAGEKVRGRPALSADQDEVETARRRRASRVLRRVVWLACAAPAAPPYARTRGTIALFTF
jgi:hypothetical protein